MFASRLLLSASLGIFMLPSLARAADKPMSGKELASFLTSGDLQYTAGTSVRKLHYNTDGTVSQINADGVTMTGKWKGQGNQYCTMWPFRKNWKCFGIVTTADGKFGDVEDGKITGYFSR